MIKRVWLVVIVLCAMLALATGAAAEKPGDAAGSACATIQDGTIRAWEGLPANPALVTITTGFDRWGYNYQAQTFIGPYNNASRSSCEGETWCTAVQAIRLRMKWNDAFRSTTSCDGDLYLDVHSGLPSYIGSGAAFTNQISGEYVGKGAFEGQRCTWKHDLSIAARPDDAELRLDGRWYVNNVEIGRKVQFTGDTAPSQVFMTVAESYSDPCGQLGPALGAFVGVDYKSPVRPGNR